MWQRWAASEATPGPRTPSSTAATATGPASAAARAAYTAGGTSKPCTGRMAHGPEYEMVYSAREMMSIV